MSFVTSVLTEIAHVELPFPPIVFGAIAVVIFFAGGIVTLSYSNVHRRHSNKTDLHAPHAPTNTQITTGGPGH